MRVVDTFVIVSRLTENSPMNPDSALGYQTPWEYEATWQRTEASEATNY